jgi:hypothetical protein
LWVRELQKRTARSALGIATAVPAKHAPATAAVAPVIFSAGDGLRACDDELLPCLEDGNGRHAGSNVELSTILIKRTRIQDPATGRGGIVVCPFKLA